MAKLSAKDLERQVERKALAESEAQTAIIRLLSGLDRTSKERVLKAAIHVLAAEELVPGFLDRFLRAEQLPVLNAPNLPQSKSRNPGLRKRPK